MLSSASINAYTDEKFVLALKFVYRKEQMLGKDKRTVTECGIPHIASGGILDQSHFFPDPCNAYPEGVSV